MHASHEESMAQDSGNLGGASFPKKAERGALTSALKIETRSIHDEVESGTNINRILGGALDPARARLVEKGEITEQELERRREQYRRVYNAALQASYGFELALEKLIDDSEIGAELREVLGLDDSGVRASELIAKDLEALGLEKPTAQCELPEIKSVAEAIGIYYVRAGSRMGGMVIAKQVKESLDLDEGSSFYEYVGPETMKQFQDFIQRADAFSDDPAEIKEAVQAAKAAFRAVSAWQDLVYMEALPDLYKREGNPVGRLFGRIKNWLIQDDE